jgi:hypothetical protein
MPKPKPDPKTKPPSQAELISGLAEVLLRPACQSIDFSYHGFRVNGRGYRAVVSAVSEGKIHLVISDKALRNNALAGFDGVDTIKFAPNFTFSAPAAEMTLVHESTHASFAVQYPGTRMSTLNNEALAYLAMTIYNRLVPPTAQDPWTDFTGLWSSALSAAKNVRRGAEIDETTMKTITDGIMSDSRVQSELIGTPTSNFDGLPK